MPAIDISKLPRDATGQPVYPTDPGYQRALDMQNQSLSRMDERLGKIPVQSDVPVPTTPQPSPLGLAYSAPSINPTEKLATTLLSEDKQEPSIWDKVRNDYLTPIGEGIGKSTKYLGDVGQSLYEGAKGTASDVGNWADQNRVGLGGFATAIGAGLARRDPSEALANYNKSIIQNKQQRQEEEKFKMATDGSHPYNQQFRELFAKMLPDVTAKLGERFGQMTVQNFKDAGMGDLPDLIMKQLEISKNDASSPISVKQRGILNEQYKINIPDNIPYNLQDQYIKKVLLDKEQGFKEREIKNKEEKLALDVNKETADESIQSQKLKLQEAENKRQQEIFTPQLDKAKSEAKREEYLEKSLNPESELSKKSQQNFYKNFPKYKKYVSENDSNSEINKIIKDVMPDLQRTEMTTTSAEKRTIIEQKARQKIEGIRQGAANLRVKMQQSGANYRTSQTTALGYARLNETERSNKAREELLKNKESAKYGDAFIAEKDLSIYGLSPANIKKEIDQATGAIQIASQSREIMNNIDKIGLKEVMGLSALSGRLQTLSVQLNMTYKQKEAMGAYDEGVKKLMEAMKTSPRDVKLILGYKEAVKAQYKQMMDTVNEAYITKGNQMGYDARFGSPIDYTQELKAAIDGDSEMIDKFKQFGYDSDTMLDIYKNRSFKVRKRGE